LHTFLSEQTLFTLTIDYLEAYAEIQFPLHIKQHSYYYLDWGDPDVDGRIILRWIFRKLEGWGTGWSWLRIGTGGGHL
jgi:hypothetical protein